jgi:hypothetical protein
MGYMLPSPDSPSERARSCIARKDVLEAKLEVQGSILKVNNTDMCQPLVDHEGYPCDNLDVWAVRRACVRIIKLRNDLAVLMDEIADDHRHLRRRARVLARVVPPLLLLSQGKQRYPNYYHLLG